MLRKMYSIGLKSVSRTDIIDARTFTATVDAEEKQDDI